MAPKKQPQPILPLIGGAALILALIAQYFTYPGFIIFYIGLLFASLAEPTEQLQKPARALLTNLFIPCLKPWTPIFFVCFNFAVFIFFLPHIASIPGYETLNLAYLPLFNALAAFLCIGAIEKTIRCGMHKNIEIPEIVFSKPKEKFLRIGFIVFLMIVSVVGGFFSFWVSGGFALCMLIFYFIEAHPVVKTWRQNTKASDKWETVFNSIFPKSPSPIVKKHCEYQNFSCDTIMLPVGLSINDILAKQNTARSFLPVDKETFFTFAPTPDCFLAIEAPVGVLPDFTNPNIDKEELYAGLSLALARGVDGCLNGRVDALQRIQIGDFSSLHSDTSATALWFCPLAHGHSDSAVNQVSLYYGEKSGIEKYVCDDKLLQIFIFGDLDAEKDLTNPVLKHYASFLRTRPSQKTLEEYCQRLEEEATWVKRWNSIKKVSGFPPEIQWGTRKTQKIGQTNLTQISFVTLNGIEPEVYMGLEKEIQATLQGAPFASVTGYSTDRNGTRHRQAFSLTFSDGPVPYSLEDVQDNLWVLAGIINRGFDAARLARPELVSARPLYRDGMKQLWEIKLRLYGGVSVNDMRKKITTLAASFSVHWIGIKPDGTLIAGARFVKDNLIKKTDEKWISNILWQQAFEAAKIISLAGGLPEVLSVESLEYNQKISKLVFRLPPGISLTDVNKVRSKLASTTGNIFCQFHPDEKDGRNIIGLVSKTDPLAMLIPYRFDWADNNLGMVPLGTSIDGSPICWDPDIDPHLLFIGLTGSGKTAALQALLYGCLLNSWDVVLGDAYKGAADFKNLSPYFSALSNTLEADGGRFDIASMLGAVYEEVTRRVALNTQYGVSSFTKLPEEIRPKRLIVVLDEFNSLITKTGGADDTALEQIGVYTAGIAAQARSAGISLVLAAQSIRADDLKKIPGGGGLRTNLSRILLGKANYGDKTAALRSPDDAPDLGNFVPRGRGVFEPVTGETKIIQFWFSEAYAAQLSLRRDSSEIKRLEYKRGEIHFEGKIINDHEGKDYGVIEIDW